MKFPDHDGPMTIDELRRVHLFHAVTIDEAPAVEVPEGWSVATRHWGWRSWDALIQSRDCFGWRLGGKMASSRRRAAKRATAEIRAHVATCTNCARG